MEKAEIRQKLDELGIKYNARLSAEKLMALLPEDVSCETPEQVEAPVEEVAEEQEEVVEEPKEEMRSSESRTFTQDGVKYMKFYNEKGDTLKIVKL